VHAVAHTQQNLISPQTASPILPWQREELRRDLWDQPRTQESQTTSSAVHIYTKWLDSASWWSVNLGDVSRTSLDTSVSWYYDSLAIVIHTKQCTAYSPYQAYYHRRGLSRFIYIYDCHTIRLRWLLLIPVSRLSWLRYLARRKQKIDTK
jgi:hypothetical protein